MYASRAVSVGKIWRDEDASRGGSSVNCSEVGFRSGSSKAEI